MPTTPWRSYGASRAKGNYGSYHKNIKKYMVNCRYPDEKRVSREKQVILREREKKNNFEENRYHPPPPSGYLLRI